jgi:predicted nuclease of predicted toxin-antitoxin system
VNFVADENIDRQIVERLREDGHTVIYVAEMDPGIPDEDVIRLADMRSSTLITADKDFGELVFRQALVTHGVVLIRLAGLSQSRKAELPQSENVPLKFQMHFRLLRRVRSAFVISFRLPDNHRMDADRCFASAQNCQVIRVIGCSENKEVMNVTFYILA